jgi:hypothetical protein
MKTMILVFYISRLNINSFKIFYANFIDIIDVLSHLNDVKVPKHTKQGIYFIIQF